MGKLHLLDSCKPLGMSLLLFADDVLIVLKGNQNNLDALLDILNTFALDWK